MVATPFYISKWQSKLLDLTGMKAFIFTRLKVAHVLTISLLKAQPCNILLVNGA